MAACKIYGQCRTVCEETREKWSPSGVGAGTTQHLCQQQQQPVEQALPQHIR